jgi:Glycine zipper 2TM domain
MNTLRNPIAVRLGKALLLLGILSTLTACIVVPSRGPYHRYPHSGQRMAEAPQPVTAPPMYFVPERGQPQAVQERERYECYKWAGKETGFDPGMTTTYLPAAPARRQADGTEVVAGAATGAVVGAMVSSSRRTPEGVVIGAIFGAMLGAASQDARARSDDQAQARHVAAVQSAQGPMQNFRRAMSSCMEGRGYRVQG